MTVDPECPLAIASLTERLCEPSHNRMVTSDPSSGSSHNNIGVITGGVVAIVFIIAVAATMPIVALVMRCRCHRNVPVTETVVGK